MVTPTPRTSALALAWMGTVLFAASLIWFLYCYLVRFGMPASSGGVMSALLTDVVLFSTFALHHSVLARTAVKRRLCRIVPAALERSLYAWIASLLFIAVCTWWQPVPGVLYQLEGSWRIAASCVQLVGAILMVRASSAIDVLDLAGVRPVLQAAAKNDAPRHVPLETRGLYGFVRHPLYFAWALFVFATPVMTATRAVFAVVSTAYLVLAIPWEERGLIETFGEEYEAYRQKVRWRMIPGVY